MRPITPQIPGIPALRCPGAGKWVESDPSSRAAYAERTVQRRVALQNMGWQGALSEASAPATGELSDPGQGGPPVMVKRERKSSVRLPQDIRTELGGQVGCSYHTHMAPHLGGERPLPSATPWILCLKSNSQFLSITAKRP